MLLLYTPLSEIEITMLEGLAKNHPCANFRPRALGLLALNEGVPTATVAKVLRTHLYTVHRWAKAWRDFGVFGILGGNKGGRLATLSGSQLDCAARIAEEYPLTLRGILNKVSEQHPEMNTDLDLRILSRGLRARGLSYKRNRFSLKKNVMKSASKRQKRT